jgi:predicted RNA-binding Zn-ribbon protein involved in translation (DUF1610 family)
MTLLITDGLPRGLGYFELDHRGTDAPLMDIPGGQRYFEADTYTCSHCQLVVIVDRSKTQYKCSGCAHHICDRCAAKKKAGAPCKTYLQAVDEAMESASRGLGSRIILP